MQLAKGMQKEVPQKLSLAKKQAELSMNKNVHNVTDPVCGATLRPKEVHTRAEHLSQTFYFCSTVCKEAFERKPEMYTSKKVA